MPGAGLPARQLVDIWLVSCRHFPEDCRAPAVHQGEVRHGMRQPLNRWQYSRSHCPNVLTTMAMCGLCPQQRNFWVSDYKPGGCSEASAACTDTFRNREALGEHKPPTRQVFKKMPLFALSTTSSVVFCVIPQINTNRQACVKTWPPWQRERHSWDMDESRRNWWT